MRRFLPFSLVMLGVFLTACEEPDSDVPEVPPDGPPAPAAMERAPVTDPDPPYFTPLAGPMGSEVELWMDGLPAESRVMVGIGTVEGHQILAEEDVDEVGRLETAVTIPEGLEVNRSHYFLVADPNTQQPMSVSGAFHITDEDGGIVVRGSVIELEGEDCPTLQGPEDEVYTLAGDVPALEPGDEVQVQGVWAEDGPCRMGLTIQVSQAEVF